MPSTDRPASEANPTKLIEPVLPAYGAGCIASVAPALLTQLYGEDHSFGSFDGSVPDWLPEPARGASQVVLLVLDGFGWEQLNNDPALTPTLMAGKGGKITSVVPTTTATCLTSISTGLVPAEHGIVGYRLSVDDSRILNVLRWRTDRGDARRSIPPTVFQSHRAFGGLPATEVTRAEFLATGFSAAHLAGAGFVGWQVPSTIVVEVRRLLLDGTRFVEAYYDGLDKVAHQYGLGPYYDAELRFVDRLVGDLIDALPKGACLVVTSDHGQVNVGRSVEMPANDVLSASRLVSGEGRFRWFHAKPGAERDLEAAAVEYHSDKAWVRTRDQMLDDRWFGGPLTKQVASRLGDVALVAREAVAFLDPADTGETRLAARHGSLTSTEMHVPLLAFSAT